MTQVKGRSEVVVGIDEEEVLCTEIAYPPNKCVNVVVRDNGKFLQVVLP